MTPEHWQRIEELYHSAREREPAERAAFLGQACRGDEELRRKIELLLAQDSPSEKILDRPAADLLAESTLTQLAVGAQLGPYKIEGVLGAGGMGDVFRASDTRLGRPVAIKVSRDPFSARFEREARAISSLNHPYICTLYDVGPNYLVLELVEGETLAALIKKKGALRMELVLRYGAQIAEALAEAHAKGITHRDLKPGNLMLTRSGVKVLDFGLARSQVDLSLTASNAVLGTPAYMAPEQREGGVCDARTDIYALGLVMYEMATGKRAPETGFRPLEPPQLDQVVQTCLAPDPADRWQTAREFQIALSAVGGAGFSLPRDSSPARRRLPWIAAGVVLVALGALAFVHFREKPAALPAQRFTMAPPYNGRVDTFAISPDGRLAVIAAVVNGKRQLWLRALDEPQARPMPFTEDATYPFWSPDSRYIGFFAQNKLEKIAASGGPSQSLCDAGLGLGGSWSRSNVIVFSSGFAIQRVSAAGGVPVDVTKTKADQRYPVFLPDGRRFLYVPRGATLGTLEKPGIYVGSLDGTENRRILPDLSSVVLAPARSGTGEMGQILFVRENTLMAQPFDAESAQLAGDVFPVVEGVGLTHDSSYAPATVSDNGILLYATVGSAGGDQIVWYDRSGKLLGAVAAPGQVYNPSISPDEKSVVYQRANGSWYDLWLRDLARGTETRFTSDVSINGAPFWSPKGDRIVFVSNRNGGVFNLFQRTANGSGQDEALLTDGQFKITNQWSRDGRFIVYHVVAPNNKTHIWVLPVKGPLSERKPVPLMLTEFNETFGQLSPDSHWMAYTSDQSGRPEVYVRPFPPAEGQWTISTAGGEMARWRGDGKELFFEAADGKMMAVPVVKASAGPKPTFEAGAPVALFDAHMAHNPVDVTYAYDVTADGKRFLIDTPSGSGAASPPLNVVVNWNAVGKKWRQPAE